MRVTNQMTADLITQDLYRAQQLLLDAQVKVATGKKINKPSDDPIGMGKVLDYRKIISTIDQYNENIVHGKNQMEFTSTILEEIEALLNQAKNWALEFGSGSDMSASAALIEVKSLYDEIMDLANTKIGNNYMFGGHVTNSAPFSRDADYDANYTGDNGDITVLVGNDVQVKINANGEDIFAVDGAGGGTDAFGALERLINALGSNDSAAAFAEVANLESAIDQVQGISTETSVYYGRMKSSENFLIKYKSNIEDMLYETENMDPAQAVVEMQLQEAVYITCLETASRIIQPSLVDFIK
ncbi:MAG: flagellar hook-associated protein FlgL [Deltaproteobacteria bacterium]|nr:flagellar hook-associated protein FlgL [Deltaproteobacteria bacterium]